MVFFERGVYGIWDLNNVFLKLFVQSFASCPMFNVKKRKKTRNFVFHKRDTIDSKKNQFFKGLMIELVELLDYQNQNSAIHSNVLF